MTAAIYHLGDFRARRATNQPLFDKPTAPDIYRARVASRDGSLDDDITIETLTGTGLRFRKACKARDIVGCVLVTDNGIKGRFRNFFWVDDIPHARIATSWRIVGHPLHDCILLPDDDGTERA